MAVQVLIIMLMMSQYSGNVTSFFAFTAAYVGATYYMVSPFLFFFACLALGPGLVGLWQPVKLKKGIGP